MKMLDVLNEVLVKAMAKEPRAWLYEIQAVMKETNEQVNPADLSEMKVVFGMPENRTLIYEITEGKEIAESIVNEPWLEDRPLPHSISDGPESAYKRMLQAKLAYKAVLPALTLRFPLHPDATEVVYIFNVDSEEKDKRFVSVGLYSGDVKFIQ